MHISLHRHSLRLRTAFTIARNSTTVRKTTIVELHDGNGTTGYGEVSDNQYYTQAHPDEVSRRLAALQAVLAKADPDKPTQLHAQILGLNDWQGEHANPFALSALDMAAHDLAARRTGKPLYEYWGYSWAQHSIPVSNYTLSIDSPEAVLAQAQANPWPSYKVKLGGQYDLETIELLRKALSADTRLCVDANAGWEFSEAVDKVARLGKLNVAFIEQPMARGAYTETARLRASLSKGHPPLIADEDCQVEADVARCAEAYDAINIKLSKCGGPTAALRMVEQARSLGLGVMFGCMIESSFSIGVLRHFSPVADFIDLDGALLVANDPGAGVEFLSSGLPAKPVGIGSGVRWAQGLPA